MARKDGEKLMKASFLIYLEHTRYIACSGRKKMDVKKSPPPFLFLPSPFFSFSSFSFSSSLLSLF